MCDNLKNLLKFLKLRIEINLLILSLFINLFSRLILFRVSPFSQYFLFTVLATNQRAFCDDGAAQGKSKHDDKIIAFPFKMCVTLLEKLFNSYF